MFGNVFCYKCLPLSQFIVVCRQFCRPRMWGIFPNRFTYLLTIEYDRASSRLYLKTMLFPMIFCRYTLSGTYISAMCFWFLPITVVSWRKIQINMSHTNLEFLPILIQTKLILNERGGSEVLLFVEKYPNLEFFGDKIILASVYG